MTSDAANVPSVEGAREALVERITEAIEASPNGVWTILTGPTRLAPSFARAVLPLVDAEVAAAVSEAQAEVERLARWKSEASEVILGLQDLGKALNLPLGFRITGEDAAEAARRLVADRDASRDAHDRAIVQMSEWIARAESAEAEVERLREGIRALADDDSRHLVRWIDDSHLVDVSDLRALLAPSPAATTGEAGAVFTCKHCGHGTFNAARVCAPCRFAQKSAPVSSGEAGTGEAVQP